MQPSDKAKSFLDDGLSAEGNFWMEYDREGEDGNFIIRIYDKNQSYYAEVHSPDFADTFRHALHYADPLLAAWLFPDYYNWSFKHKVVYDQEREEQ